MNRNVRYQRGNRPEGTLIARLICLLFSTMGSSWSKNGEIVSEIGDDSVQAITSRHSTAHLLAPFPPPARQVVGQRSLNCVSPVKSESISGTHTPLGHIPSFTPHPFTPGHDAAHSPVRQRVVPEGQLVVEACGAEQRSADF